MSDDIATQKFYAELLQKQDQIIDLLDKILLQGILKPSKIPDKPATKFVAKKSTPKVKEETKPAAKKAVAKKKKA